MATRVFPYGSVILSMEYVAGLLTISFKKKNGMQKRSYENVPTDVAYKLYYENDPKQIMSFYSNNIKQKYIVKEVING